MFGLGMGEIVIIAIVALLALGPEKLPEAAKKIGEAIRGLRKQTSELRKTIEEDTQLGDAMREIRTALHEDPLAKRPKAKPSKMPPAGAPVGPAPEDGVAEESLFTPVADAVATDDDVTVPNAIAEAKPATNGSTNSSETNSDDSDVSARVAVELSEYERYIHNNGTQAAADKFGTSLEHAEAAMTASLARATHDG